MATTRRNSGPRVRRLDLRLDPLAALGAWPADAPLALLHSGRGHARWARWSILAAPRAFARLDGPDALATLDARVAPDLPPGDLPFVGGWIGVLAYDLGRLVEPAAAGPVAADDRRWAPIELAHCPDALLFDHRERTWWAVGDPQLPDPSAAPPPTPAAPPGRGAVRTSLPRARYLDAVERGLALIAAGDVFQVNLTQRLTAPWSGSTRALAAATLPAAGAWYGAVLELPEGRGLVSLSPELFLELDPRDRAVVTRPIKGTRPATVAPRELERSAKDAAELHMIIDLLRNDLGRVCAYGSVRVPRGRIIESHPTVHHGVGEVHGRLRDGVTAGGLLAATFPGGSVTGAPKIRAMQIIDEIEPVRRGPYCGAIGFFSRCGRMTLNVAIRTMALTGARPAGRWDVLDGLLDYGAGGGVVADSIPELEWQESLDKCAVLWGAAAEPARAGAR